MKHAALFLFFGGIAFAGGQTTAKTTRPAFNSYVPLPSDIRCSLTDSKMDLVAAKNEYLIQGGTVGGVRCRVRVSGRDRERDVLLASNEVAMGGVLKSKAFGTLRFRELTDSNRVGSEYEVFSIRRDMVQPLRAFLQKGNEVPGEVSETSSSQNRTTGVFVEPGSQVRTSQSNQSGAGSLPPSNTGGGPPPVEGIPEPLFTERYIDIKVGTGAPAEPQKLYKVQYTGYLAATGVKFDSSFDHRAPVLKDGKPVMGPDGKPELGDPQPLIFPQGFGRLIPGFDQGFAGMRIGGKRRTFIPWQLAYGMRDIPAHGLEHPGIPPKSDLIFDVELLDVMDLPTQAGHPMGAAPPHPGTGATVSPNPVPGGDATQSAPAPAPSPAPGKPAAPAQPAAPATPPEPQSN